MHWKPIETEPQDASHRLVTINPADPSKAYIVSLVKGEHYFAWTADSMERKLHIIPTHWCAIPVD